jgi:dipeptidyl-peptidase 4
MKTKQLLFAFLIVSLASVAQLKQLTMEDAVLGARSYLRTQTLNGIQFIPGTNSVVYVRPDYTIEIFDPSTSKKQSLKNLTEITGLLEKKNEKGRFSLSAMKWISATTFRLPVGSMWYDIDPFKGEITGSEKNLGYGLDNADRCEKNGWVAFTKENNLLINKQGTELQVSNETDPNIIYGGAGVHRNEFGISKGTFWSPQGNFLAFYRMDQRMVKDYPIINWLESTAQNNNIKYPMAGGISHQVTLGIFNITTGKTIYLKTDGPDDHYLTNVAWSPDEKRIYIAELNRDQNHMKLNEYDAASGNFIKTLYEEKDEKYVEPLHPMLFLPKNPNQFIWQSRKDGYNHLYLFDINGKLIRQLTSGAWEVLSVTGFDDKCEKLFFHANRSAAINKDFLCVTLSNGKMEQITSENGYHTCQVNEKGNIIIDDYVNAATPKKINILQPGKKKSELIFTAENPLKDYAIGSVKLFSISNEKGIPLWCRMYLPPGFDSTKKYPVIDYLYGGPHHQEVLNTFNGSGNLWFTYMAQRGFIVFTLDNRGSENRGKEFEQATFRNLGTTEMEDQLIGVNYLKKLPYVDATRIGVHGWSFGGFMTTSLMTRLPGTFKVAVGGGPVIDWSMYEVMYTERYMDTPESNPDGFKKSNLYQYIGNLKGKLMLIHGTDDDVVVWQHSMNYLKNCVDKNVQIDYFVYPGHQHNVLGKDRVHLMQKITDYFLLHL